MSRMITILFAGLLVVAPGTAFGQQSVNQKFAEYIREHIGEGFVPSCGTLQSQCEDADNTAEEVCTAYGPLSPECDFYVGSSVACWTNYANQGC